MSDARVTRLTGLRDRLRALPMDDRGPIRAWIAEARVIVRNDWPASLTDFETAATEPKKVSVPFAVLRAERGSPRPDTRPGDEARTREWKQRLLAVLDGILAVGTCPGSPAVNAEPVQVVETICRRFPAFARQMGVRGRSRPPVTVKDEYDVQYLMHALLRMHFDDIRPEEYVPSYAGGNSRTDFLLKKERIAVEAKMTRSGLRDKEVGEQLLVDIARYANHPDCDDLLCFVYDPAGLVANPAGLMSDLSVQRGRIRVAVVIS